MSIPVYLITGFLDAGKTSYIQRALNDPDFGAAEKTLVLLCEEGEEEYAADQMAGPNVQFRTVEQESDLTTDFLNQCQKETHAKRIIIEYNGMWQLSSLYNAMPKRWQVYQIILIADASTFPVYLANMRQLVVDKLQDPEVVIFNRISASTDKTELLRPVRMVNRFTNVVYERTDGTIDNEEVKLPLPFDLDAPVIEIDDRDFGLWYIDAMENLDRYIGKTVRFLGYVCQTPRLPKNCFAAGRFAMICCADDVTYFGVACECPNAADFPHRSWVTVEAVVDRGEHEIYNGEGPWLKDARVTPAQPPEEELVSFSL